MDNEKRLQMLRDMSLQELHIALNKYCSPDRMLMSIKKYGTILSTHEVEAEILDRMLLTDETV